MDSHLDGDHWQRRNRDMLVTHRNCQLPNDPDYEDWHLCGCGNYWLWEGIGWLRIKEDGSRWTDGWHPGYLWIS